MRIGRMIIGLCVGVMLAAGAAQAQTKIAIGYGPSTVWMPAFVAKDQGFFANHGIDATLTLIPVGSRSTAGADRGSDPGLGHEPDHSAAGR